MAFRNGGFEPAGGVAGEIGGPWSAGVPPNSTSGTAFTVTEAGIYVVTATASAFAPAAGNRVFRAWINGYGGAQKHFYFNQAGVHAVMGSAVQELSLKAGANYLWIQSDASSDTFDMCSLTWIRTG